MPRYAQNPDGTLTIVDDSASSHQPAAPPPRPTDRRNGRDHSSNGFPLLRARMHVLLILLGIVAAAFFLCSCSETGGEFAHGMNDSAWAEFKGSDGPHSVVEQAGDALDGHEFTFGGAFDGLDGHDWAYAPGILAPGIESAFDNAGQTIEELMGMADEGLGRLGEEIFE